MHVTYAVVPCLPSLLQMWSQKFGYQPITKAEQEALEGQIVFMDPRTTYLIKKPLQKYALITPYCLSALRICI